MKHILFLLLLAVYSSSISQHALTLYHMDNANQRNKLNPALMPQGRVNLNFSSFAIKLNSNLLNANIFFDSDSTFLPKEEIAKNLKDVSYANFESDLEFFNIGFYKKNNYFGFMLGSVNNLSFNIPKEMTDIILLGAKNYSFGTKFQIEDYNFEFTNYLYFASYWQRRLNDKITIAFVPKYLYGLLSTKSNGNFSLTVDTSQLNVIMDGEIHYKGNSVFSDASEFINDISGNGMAIDAGIEYNINKKLKLGASILDLGYIKYLGKQLDKTYIFDNKTISFDDYLDSNTNYNNIDQEISNLFLLEATTSNSTETKYKDYIKNALDPKFLLSINYNLLNINKNKLNIGFTNYNKYSTSLQKLFSTFNLSTIYQRGNWLNLALSYSYNKYYDELGIGTAINIGPFQFMVASDIIPKTNFNFKSFNLKNSLVYSDFNVNVGLAFNFGRKKQKYFIENNTLNGYEEFKKEAKNEK